MTDPMGEPEIPHEDLDVIRQAVDKLDGLSRNIGLHLINEDFVSLPGPDGEPQIAVVANFLIGDLAWSDRVQNPQAEADADEFAAIETQLVRERVMELRDKMRRKPEGEADGQQ